MGLVARKRVIYVIGKPDGTILCGPYPYYHHKDREEDFEIPPEGYLPSKINLPFLTGDCMNNYQFFIIGLERVIIGGAREIHLSTIE